MTTAALLTIDDVRARFNVSRKTVIGLIPKLKGFKVGRQWRFDPADVRAFEEAQKPTGEPTRSMTVLPVVRPNRAMASRNWKGADFYR
mgnify:CR=1 FL=1